MSPVLIHRGNSLHLRVCQFKVENIKVLGNVRLIAGTGDGDITSLQVPAEDDLGVGLAVLLGKLGEYRLIQQPRVTVAQGIPRLQHGPAGGHPLLQSLLLEVGVQLHLENSGLDLGGGNHFLQPSDIHI